MESIAAISKHSTSLIRTPEIPETLNQPGRLLFEVESRANAVLIELESAIIKAGMRMGLRIDNEAEKAKDYLTYVQMNYRTAYLADLIHSLELASIGEIEKANQLNVLSVLNLCQWFKIYWDQHRHKYIQKPEIKLLEPMSEQSKTAEVRKAMESWLALSKGEKILMSAYYYQKFWDWGILNDMNLTKEARRNAYNERISKYALSIPTSILSDPIKRKSARQMIDQCTADNGVFTPPVSYVPFEKNDLHKLVLEECRNEMLNQVVEKMGAESILRLFDDFHK